MENDTMTGEAVLPSTDAEVDAEELTVSDLAELDWDGDGRIRGGGGDLEDARHDNTLRAGAAVIALEAYADRMGGLHTDPAVQQLGDLLGDLRHLADALGVRWEFLLDRADGDYWDEVSRG